MTEPSTPDPVVSTPTVTPVDQRDVSAFNKGRKDIVKVFTNYKKRVRNVVILRKHQLKIDLVIKVRMSRQDQEGEQQEVSQAFYGGLKLILRQEDFDEAYDESVKKIWIDFDHWFSNGSDGYWKG